MIGLRSPTRNLRDLDPPYGEKCGLARSVPVYAELHAKTNFPFLEGASHPDELVRRAAELGYRALAVTDRNSLAGVVGARRRREGHWAETHRRRRDHPKRAAGGPLGR